MSSQSSALRKITVALPDDLVDYADRQAQRDHTSRSQVIGLALAQARTRDRERLAAEGYRFYAGEAAEFAEAAAAAVAEAWGDELAGEGSSAHGS